MLVLTRRLGESIVISDDIRVTVVSMNGGQVRIGIDAPKQVSVHRQEVYERIHSEQNQTAKAAADR